MGKEKFDVLTSVNADEKAIFYMPFLNLFIAGEGRLKDSEIYSTRKNIQFVEYKNLKVDGKKILATYVILLSLSLLISIIFKNNLFPTTMVVVVFDIVRKRRTAQYIADAFVWLVDQNLRKQRSWIGAALMAMRAYKRFERIPSIEEIERENRYFISEDFETKLNLSQAIILTICGITNYFNQTKDIIIIIGLALALLGTTALLKGPLNKFFYWYMTAKPTNRQLEVARESLKEYDKMVEELSNRSDFEIFKPLLDAQTVSCYGRIFSVEPVYDYYEIKIK